MKTVEQEITRIRDWRHDLPNKLVAPLQAELVAVGDLISDLRTTVLAQRDSVSGEHRAITRRDVAVFVAGASALAALGKLLGWF